MAPGYSFLRFSRFDARTGHLSPKFRQAAFNVGNCSLEDDRSLVKRAAMPDQSLQVTIILLRPGRFCLAHALVLYRS
jgi:hypothetical protein